MALTSSELTKWKNSAQSGVAGCSARGWPTRTDGGSPRRILGEEAVHQGWRHHLTLLLENLGLRAARTLPTHSWNQSVVCSPHCPQTGAA